MKTITHKTLALSVLLIAASLTVLIGSTAQAQTYKTGFNTKLVLPSAGNDPTNVFTIVSGTLTGPLSWTLPTTAGSSGNVLSTDGSGHLSWVPATSSVTLGGDVTGPSGSNSIANTAGNDIVAALNNVLTTSAINVPVGITGTSLSAGSGSISTSGTVSGGTGTFTNLSGTTMTGDIALGGHNISGGGTITGTTITGTSVTAGSGTISTTGAIDGNTGVFTSTLSAVGLTSTGGLTVSGGTTNIATTDASTVNIGTGAANANAINIGNSGSTTTFLGTVNMPSGSVSASSIGLTTNDLMVGVAGHGSALATANNGVLVTDNSGVPSISSSLPSGLTIPSPSISSPTITGSVTLPANSVTNADLQNSSLTVTAGTGLSGGGSVALGASTTVSLDVTHANTWTGTQTLGGAALTSSTPTTLAANTADWALSTSNSYFIISAAPSAVNVSGIAGGADGRVIVLVNTGSNAITLVSEDAVNESTAANRFHFAGGAGNNAILAPDGTVTLIYDGSTSRWRMIASE